LFPHKCGRRQPEEFEDLLLIMTDLGKLLLPIIGILQEVLNKFSLFGI
jgi:hypothetical protein